MKLITNNKALLVAIVMLLVPLTSSAVPITVDFGGVVTALDGAWASQGGVGSLLTGSYTYDDSAADGVPGANIDNFRSDTNGNGVYGWNITVMLGTTEASWSTGSAGTGPNALGLSLNDHPNKASKQRYSFGTDNFNVDMFYKLASDGGSLDDLILDGTAPSAAPDFSLIDPARAKGKFVVSDPAVFGTNTNSVDGNLYWDLTSMTTRVAPVARVANANKVPEPSALLLFGAGLAALGMRRFRRRR